MQVPTASTAPKPGLNKTILATGAPGEQPASGSAPAALETVPSMQIGSMRVSRRALSIAGIVAGGIALLLLLTCLVGMFSSAGEREKFAKAQKEFDKAQKEFDKAQKELEEQKKTIQQKETMLAQQRQIELNQQKQFMKLLADQKTERERLNEKIQRDNEAFKNNKELLAAAQDKAKREQVEIDRKEREALAERNKIDLETKTRLAALKNELDAATQRAEDARRNAQQATIIVNQPPVFHPPPFYHPAGWWNRGMGWGW